MNIKEEWIKRFREYMGQFISVTDDDWLGIRNLLSLEKISKKEYFIRPNEKTNKIGFIIKGTLRTYFVSENGNEYTTDFCTENEISVNYQISANNNEDYYSQALEDSIVLVMDYSDLLKLEEKDDKWNMLISRIIEFYYPLKIEREKNLLSLNAEEKYLHFIQKYSKILNKIPQYQIASYLGITPIALSRVKKKLKK